ncbi:hypothetical protein [Alkalimarinus sediminis]|uniref:DUF3887 domain-containing protein n=1 Tax=Alkalimarinus sediminis TaxID=1632866 RepID=A0A9E8HGD5_9ALTE|nr:hypothetical protein [Alkalimarinus sediminis]UZW73727.1 hypothetical protein NNL22_11835 [Alkalimarinus sediminis]
MRWFMIALFSVALSYSSATLASDPTATNKAGTKKDTKEQLSKAGSDFMSLLLKGRTEQAYQTLLAEVGGDSDRLNQQATDVAAFMLKVREQLGDPISYDLITTDSIKNHFFKQKYLLKFDNAAIVWEINYYQPRDGWKLVDVAYNTDIDALFK